MQRINEQINSKINEVMSDEEQITETEIMNIRLSLRIVKSKYKVKSKKLYLQTVASLSPHHYVFSLIPFAPYIMPLISDV